VLLVLEGRLRESALGVLGGHRVDTVTDRARLVEMVRKNHYDLALLEGDLDTLSSIKNADPRVEVIYFGDCRSGEIEIISRGASYCLSAETSAEKIRESVETISELSGSRKETALLEKLLTEKYTFAGWQAKTP